MYRKRVQHLVGIASLLVLVGLVLYACRDIPVAAPQVDAPALLSAHQGAGSATVEVTVLGRTGQGNKTAPVEGVAVRALHKTKSGLYKLDFTDENGMHEFSLDAGPADPGKLTGEPYCFFVTPLGEDAFSTNVLPEIEAEAPAKPESLNDFPPLAAAIAGLEMRDRHSQQGLRLRRSDSRPLTFDNYMTFCETSPVRLQAGDKLEIEIVLPLANRVEIEWTDPEGNTFVQGAYAFLYLDVEDHEPKWFEDLNLAADVRPGILATADPSGHLDVGMEPLWVEMQFTQFLLGSQLTGNCLTDDPECEAVVFMCPINDVPESQAPKAGNVGPNDLDLRGPAEHGWLGTISGGSIVPEPTKWAAGWNQKGAGSAVLRIWSGAPPETNQARLTVAYTCTPDADGPNCSHVIASHNAAASNVKVELATKWTDGTKSEYRLTWVVTGLSEGNLEWRVEVDSEDGGDSLPNPDRSSGSKVLTADAKGEPCTDPQSTTDDRFSVI